MPLGDGDHRGSGHREGPDAAPGDPRPAPSPTATLTVTVPLYWPEAVAYATGRRLADGDADEVPMMLRQGLPIYMYLTGLETEALVQLPEPIWRRWFFLGWAHRTADDEEV